MFVMPPHLLPHASSHHACGTLYAGEYVSDPYYSCYIDVIQDTIVTLHMLFIKIKNCWIAKFLFPAIYYNASNIQ